MYLSGFIQLSSFFFPSTDTLTFLFYSYYSKTKKVSIALNETFKGLSGARDSLNFYSLVNLRLNSDWLQQTDPGGNRGSCLTINEFTLIKRKVLFRFLEKTNKNKTVPNPQTYVNLWAHKFIYVLICMYIHTYLHTYIQFLPVLFIKHCECCFCAILISFYAANQC